MKSAAMDIRDRFDTEQAYVRRYVAFLEAATGVQHGQVYEVLRILQRHQVASIPHERDWPRWELYSTSELTDLLGHLQPALRELDAAIDSAEQSLSRLPKPLDVHKIDARSNIGEWIEFARDTLRNAEDQAELAGLHHQIEEQQERNVRELGKDADVLTRDQVGYVLQSAAFLVAGRRLYELRFARDSIRELELLTRITRPDTELSNLRQGFILLMTAFDAAVFDLTRLALRLDFFGLIGPFGKQDKLSLDDLGRYRSFEKFRDAQIEQQLRGRYLRELLFVLDDLGVALADPSKGDRLIHLIELVMRRNIQVHNRGVVDERYLEKDNSGTPRFNVYNLHLGVVAHIDSAYWKRANDLTATAIQRIAGWVESRQP